MWRSPCLCVLGWKLVSEVDVMEEEKLILVMIAGDLFHDAVYLEMWTAGIRMINGGNEIEGKCKSDLL